MRGPCALTITSAMAAEPSSQPVPSAGVLAMSRGRSAANLTTGLVSTGVGAIWIGYGFPPGWLVAGYGAFFAVLHALSLVRPVTLRLDADGFVLPDLLRRPHRHQWTQVSDFVTWGPGKRKVAVLYSSQGDRRPLRFLSIFLTGGDALIPAGFGGQSSAQLADLMNDYRDAVVAPEDSSRTVAAELTASRRELPSRRSRLVSELLLWVGMALLASAYVIFKTEGSPVLWAPLTGAGAVLFVAYVLRH